MITQLAIRLPDDLAELIRGLHPQLKSRIKAALAMLFEDPYRGKVLQEELAGLRSFRVKRMRIIYRVSREAIIEVIAIGPRKTIYEETFRLISKEGAK